MFIFLSSKEKIKKEIRYNFKRKQPTTKHLLERYGI